MEKDEMIRQRQANFRQTNAYAMQNGMILGVWVIMCHAFFVAGLSNPLFSNFWLLTLLGIPVVDCFLTLRFRRIVGLDINFPFARGFIHSFLTLLYTAVWAAVVTFVYLQFFDNGYIFDCYAHNLSDPQTIKMMEESGMMQQVKEATNGLTPVDLVNQMRAFGAGNYAAMIIYFYIFASPVISVIVGLVCMRRVHYKNR